MCGRLAVMIQFIRQDVQGDFLLANGFIDSFMAHSWKLALSRLRVWCFKMLLLFKEQHCPFPANST